mmetsp:Transcript_31946/g.66992  ORF Transcript_31946/g.66992 Transcript_31946/m.66992 type:complete len:221 (-) Transcript_31946:279-941(-)
MVSNVFRGRWGAWSAFLDAWGWALQEWTTATIQMHPLSSHQLAAPRTMSSRDALPKYGPVPEEASSIATPTTIASLVLVPTLRHMLPPSQIRPHCPRDRPQLRRRRWMARHLTADTVSSKSTAIAPLPNPAPRDRTISAVDSKCASATPTADQPPRAAPCRNRPRKRPRPLRNHATSSAWRPSPATGVLPRRANSTCPTASRSTLVSFARATANAPRTTR